MAMANADVVFNCDDEGKPKRRYTLNSGATGGGGGRYNNNKRKRRSDIVLPTKFLLGGNINDPLNLASFTGDINQVTPQSSPLPTPKHKKEVEVLIPVNLADPLNLNSSDPEAISPIPVSKIKKVRKRKRKRTDSETTVEDEAGTIAANTAAAATLGGTSTSSTDQEGPVHGDEAMKETNEKNEKNEPLNGLESEKQANKEESVNTNTNESVIPAKCPKTSMHKKEIDRTIKDPAGESNENSSDADEKATNHHPQPLPQQQQQPHFRSSHHSRFNRGAHHHHYHHHYNPYHHYGYQHGNRHHQQQPQPQHKFRAKDARFQYGNYDRYYGYRNQNMAPDPRLRSFKKEWFEDQDILDIGCNVGHVTLTIARDFNPKRIIGTDIDENLIKAAIRNIRHYVNSNQSFLKKRLDTGGVSKQRNDSTDFMKAEIQKTIEFQGKPGELKESKEETYNQQLVGDKTETTIVAKENVEPTSAEQFKCDSTKETTISEQCSSSSPLSLHMSPESLSKPKNISTDSTSINQLASSKVQFDEKNKDSLSNETEICLQKDINTQSEVTHEETISSVTSTLPSKTDNKLSSSANEANISLDKAKESQEITCSKIEKEEQGSKLDLSNNLQSKEQTSSLTTTTSLSSAPSTSPIIPSASIFSCNDHNQLDSRTNKSEIKPCTAFETCTSPAPPLSSTPPLSSSSTSKMNHFAKPSNFPGNVQFVCTNYVFDSDEQLKTVKSEYDCILCLSVTKWIHLNFGDKGLKRAFKRMYAQLRPGGKLILEAQPWCSYKKKKYLTETTLNNYWSIKFKPDHFNEYLLSKEVGFATLELVDTPAHESKGFRRPIFLFRKAKEDT